MMTYDEIKDKYPLGCEVRTDLLYQAIGSVEGRGRCSGKLLAVLDPSKHGPRCLLFKIEKPEGRRVSNEQPRATILRKGPPFDSEHKAYHKRAKAICAGVEEAKNGTLKWITPSEVKERVDTKKGGISTDEFLEKARNAGKAMREAMDNPKNKEPMDRTEQLKRILKPGMKVKLKETTEDWPGGVNGSIRNTLTRLAKDKGILGRWVTYKEPNYHFPENFFLKEFPQNIPFAMIDKVEGEEDTEEKARSEGRILETMEHDDTIPVPRDRMKDTLREFYKVYPRQQMRAIESFLSDSIHQDDLNTLLQEIEEEEKYASLDYFLIRSGEDHVAKMKDGNMWVHKAYVPEIHKEGGQYVVKFKREE